jgi:hypothetical protein
LDCEAALEAECHQQVEREKSSDWAGDLKIGSHKTGDQSDHEKQD